jgi:hypothetical protein
VAETLKVGDRRALIVLHALGWPLEAVEQGNGSLPAFAPHEDFLADEIAACVLDAETWPAAAGRIKRRCGLGEEAMFSARAGACRHAVQAAFDGRREMDEAAEVLGKCADLAPAQADAVLAMAGALRLVEGGEEAMCALDVMAADHTELASMLRTVTRRARDSQ